MKKRILLLWKDQSGAIAVLGALTITVFLAFVALAVDVGHLTVVRNQLQRTADAAALAGVRGLYPDNLAGADPYASYIDTAKALTRANATLTGNPVDGCALATEDVVRKLGIYDWTNKTFSEESSQKTNAVLVQINNYLVNNFFGGFVGQNQSTISVKSLAVMDYVKGLPPGNLPIAVGKDYLGQINSDLTLSFSNDTDDTSGWFGIPKVNTAVLTDYIDNGTCPALNVGDKINLLNGKTSAITSLSAAFTANQSNGYWDVNIPVVDDSKFVDNAAPIDSFIKFRILSIDTHNKTVTGKILGLGLTSSGAIGGGSKSGLLTTPRLVAYD
jgi:Flp pilus assembly protein TadG